MKISIKRDHLYRFALGLGLVTILATSACTNTVTTDSVMTKLNAQPLASSGP